MDRQDNSQEPNVFDNAECTVISGASYYAHRLVWLSSSKTRGFIVRKGHDGHATYAGRPIFKNKDGQWRAGDAYSSQPVHFGEAIDRIDRDA